MCSSYYFNANSFKRNMIFSYSVLHYFPDLQDFCAVFWQGWATDNRKSITVCFSDLRIYNIWRQIVLLSNDFHMLFFYWNELQILVFQYFRLPCKCDSTCYSFFPAFLEILSLCIVVLTKYNHKFCESLWDLNWVVLPINTLQLYIV